MPAAAPATPRGAPRSKLQSLHPRAFFLETWRDLDEEAARERQSRAASGAGYDFRPLVALSVGAVCLASMEYFGQTARGVNAILWFDTFLEFFDDPSSRNWVEELRESRWFELAGFAYWSAWRVFGYFVVPATVVRWVFRERLRDHGLETKGLLEHAWMYALSYAVVFVCVVGVTIFDPHFRTYYPFYREANRSWLDFGAWELLYAAQFFALEFFFRGFWLRAMKTALGSHAIFAMVVPYCMIHFQKPFLETIAAIVAGIVLGTLSMKTRSIWSGFLIHVSVAITMDVSALLATEGLPQRWLP